MRSNRQARTRVTVVLCASLCIPLTDAATQAGPQTRAAQPLVIESQGSFFVGGQLRHTVVDGSNRAAALGLGNEDDIVVNQMYVQYQIPQNHGAHLPVVMMHGCCLSGKTWETTPDGRMGWAEYFLRQGRPVYIPDQTARGRSGFDATRINQAKLGADSATVPEVFTFGRYNAWKVFRFGPEYPNAFADQQFPVSQFNELAKQVIPDLNATLPNPNPTFANLAALSAQLGGAVLIGHSESAFFPERAALLDATAVKGVISIEGSCPGNLTPEQLSVLAKIPVLFVWGDHIADSPVKMWTTGFADCQALVKQMVAAGGDATLLHLPEAGLKGNSHMLMQDANNLKVADLLIAWIDMHVGRSK